MYGTIGTYIGMNSYTTHHIRHAYWIALLRLAKCLQIFWTSIALKLVEMNDLQVGGNAKGKYVFPASQTNFYA